MITKTNVGLYQYGTMRLHSTADVMYTPESVGELIEILNKLKSQGKTYHLLSAGSNIVFGERVTTPIINLMSLNNNIGQNNDGTTTVGASVRIQKLINTNKANGVGGIEYLYSLPASVGGCVYMNAGRGRSANMNIADYIVSVEYLDLDDMQNKTLDGNDKFSYRHSPFQDMHAIILGVTFKFKEQSPEVTETKIIERIEYAKKTQPGNLPSCGSVFNRSNKWLMLMMRGKRVGGAMFSKKINSWISNVDNATASDVISLIKKAQRLHKWFGQECRLEIKILK